MVRNRLRRRLRAIVSERATALPVGAYVIRAGPGGAVVGFDELKVTLTQAMDRAVESRPGVLSTGRTGPGVIR